MWTVTPLPSLCGKNRSVFDITVPDEGGGGNLVGWNSKGMGMRYKYEGENLGELGVRAYRYRVGWEWSLSSMCTCTIVDDLYILS